MIAGLNLEELSTFSIYIAYHYFPAVNCEFMFLASFFHRLPFCF